MPEPDLADPALANVVWHALEGPHAAFREGNDRAARYPPDVSIFSAVPDDPTPVDWVALAQLTRPGHAATLFRAEVHEPAGWTRVIDLPAVQMAATTVDAVRDKGVIELGLADVDEMMGLVAATDPGPFGRRTIELGGYVGIRDASGELVAMGGRRVRVPGFVELSAVCTAESARGQGLAARLVRHVVAEAADDGAGVILHALASNDGAIRLYERLGFVHVRDIVAVSLTPPVEAMS